jgi:hypothetical protein
MSGMDFGAMIVKLKTIVNGKLIDIENFCELKCRNKNFGQPKK